MGKTFGQVAWQIRELVGDYQETTFSTDQIAEAIQWAQNLIIRLKGFKIASRVYSLSSYPTGALSSDTLVVKRVQLVRRDSWSGVRVGNGDSDDSGDTVLRILDESTMDLEDSSNELWRSARASYLPRRWTLIGNNKFSVVPPLMPTTNSLTNVMARVHYIKMAAAFDATDPDSLMDTSIPDYYQEAIRYAAAAYLFEKDTDFKSIQIKNEYVASFTAHMAAGVPPISVHEQDS